MGDDVEVAMKLGLGVNLTSRGTSAPDTSLFTADFINESYRVAGSPVVIGDMFDVIDGFDANAVTAAGYEDTTGVEPTLPFKGAALTTLATLAGRTVVLEYLHDGGSDTGLELFLSNGDVAMLYFWLGYGSAGVDYQYPGDPALVGTAITGVNKLAFTYDAAGISFSLNGEAATHLVRTLTTFDEVIVSVFDPNGGTAVRSIIALEPVDDAELPALSTL